MTESKSVAIAQPPSRKGYGDPSQPFLYEKEALEHLDVQFVEVDGQNPDSLLAGSRQADAIITSWGVPIDAALISQLEKCAVIALGSIGVDMVDVDAATAAGIVVTNVPDVFVEEVADHTFMLLLAATRQVKRVDKLVSQGQWKAGRPVLYQSKRIFGQTLGLYSFGNVARAVARRAQQFGLRVIAYDPFVSELSLTRENVEPVSLEDLFARSDFLSLHPPGGPDNRHVINDTTIHKLKDGVIVINTSRGPAIEESALLAALESGKVSAAGLDVLEQEPPDSSNPLLHKDNVIITPHSAPATDRMIPVTRRRAAQEVALVLSGKWPMSCVNPSVLPRVALERWQSHTMDRGRSRS